MMIDKIIGEVPVRMPTSHLKRCAAAVKERRLIAIKLVETSPWAKALNAVNPDAEYREIGIYEDLPNLIEW